jgi:hypothetical protein
MRSALVDCKQRQAGMFSVLCPLLCSTFLFVLPFPLWSPVPVLHEHPGLWFTRHLAATHASRCSWPPIATSKPLLLTCWQAPVASPGAAFLRGPSGLATVAQSQLRWFVEVDRTIDNLHGTAGCAPPGGKCHLGTVRAGPNFPSSSLLLCIKERKSPPYTWAVHTASYHRHPTDFHGLMV